MNKSRTTRPPATILDALGDGTRRTIFERVAARPTAVGELAAALPVTQPAVSQHLRVLREAGLVVGERDGRRRVYRARPQGLAPLRDYLEAMWTDVLDAYAGAARTEAGSATRTEAGSATRTEARSAARTEARSAARTSARTRASGGERDAVSRSPGSADLNEPTA